MTSLPWCRLYTEFAFDPKVQILAFEDQRHYVILLCLKGNGTLDGASASKDYRERIVAKGLGLDPVAAVEAKRRLMEGGLIDADWHPIKWESRQCKSDHSAAERKREQRNRDKERDGHDDVTTESRDSHVLDKSRGDKSREEKIKKRRRASSPPKILSAKVPPDFVPDVDHALAKIPDMDVEAELEKFRGWEFDPPRCDWSRTWSNWVQRAKDNGKYSKKQSTVRKWD